MTDGVGKAGDLDQQKEKGGHLLSYLVLIEEKKLTHWLEHFYGYGSWNANFWFVAFEEGGGDMPEEVAEKFNYFFQTHANRDAHLCNIRDMYRQVRVFWEGPKAELFGNRFEYRFGDAAIQNNIWKNLIGFVHGFQKQRLPDTMDYQKRHFASPSSQEAWIQLYPLPSPHGHAWYYNWLDLPDLDILRSRARYEEHLYETRIQTILSKLKEHRPEVVMMYGMKNVNRLKKSIGDFFNKEKFVLSKVETKRVPQHHMATIDGTKLIITTQIPVLRHNRVETGFDWEEFGKRVREK